MNQFAWLRRDYESKSRDFADVEVLPVRSPRSRKRQGRRFFGLAFSDLVPVYSAMAYTGQVQANGVSGEALTALQVVYQDSSGLWWRASANTSGKDKATGIVLNSTAAAGQPCFVLSDTQNGTINLGCAVATGSVYIVSSNLGGIVLYVDGTTPTTGWMTTIVGVAISTTFIKLCFVSDGSAAHA
jgi:hypothetical protein